jgi:hypothetical protein
MSAPVPSKAQFIATNVYSAIDISAEEVCAFCWEE